MMGFFKKQKINPTLSDMFVSSIVKSDNRTLHSDVKTKLNLNIYTQQPSGLYKRNRPRSRPE